MVAREHSARWYTSSGASYDEIRAAIQSGDLRHRRSGKVYKISEPDFEEWRERQKNGASTKPGNGRPVEAPTPRPGTKRPRTFKRRTTTTQGGKPPRILTADDVRRLT
jgi:hypothetical protein